MNLNKLFLLFVSIALMSCNAQQQNQKTEKSFIPQFEEQYDYLNENIKESFDSTKFLPRTIHDEDIRLTGIYDWTSGFYPGSLWQLYQLTGNERWKERAVEYTERLDSIQYWTGNHDVGFMIECSYGNALKHIDSEEYRQVIVQTAESLATRFRETTGVIKSWDWTDKWQYPVIIDNMMNLELMFHASKISGDKNYYNVAVEHANTTIENHFREDFSSFHVVDYDTITGKVIQKNTHQGFSDDSAWARGQSWGLYGYTLMYRETKDEKYLDMAKKIAGYIIDQSEEWGSKIPAWDYSVDGNVDQQKDVSAGTIVASALFELSQFVDNDDHLKYYNYASDLLEELYAGDYFAEAGTNEGFLLKHSVGSKPHGVEVDVPLNYADYYFLEALNRQTELLTNK